MAEVKHNTEAHSFQIAFDGGEKGVLDYVIRGSGENTVIDFIHTFVPNSQRGKGYAEKLVKAGLDWVVENKYKFAPSCWYISDVYLKRNPEYNAHRSTPAK